MFTIFQLTLSIPCPLLLRAAIKNSKTGDSFSCSSHTKIAVNDVHSVVHVAGKENLVMFSANTVYDMSMNIYLLSSFPHCLGCKQVGIILQV